MLVLKEIDSERKVVRLVVMGKIDNELRHFVSDVVGWDAEFINDNEISKASHCTGVTKVIGKNHTRVVPGA